MVVYYSSLSGLRYEMIHTLAAVGEIVTDSYE